TAAISEIRASSTTVGAGGSIGAVTTPPSPHDTSAGTTRLAIRPGGVHAAAIASAASRPTLAGAVGGRPPPGRHPASAESLGGQGMGADHVDDRGMRATRVVQVRQSVGQARTEM